MGKVRPGLGVWVQVCFLSECQRSKTSCRTNSHVDNQLCVCILFFAAEEAKRFEDGLQEQKDFHYIQKKYVSQRAGQREGSGIADTM